MVVVALLLAGALIVGNQWSDSSATIIVKDEYSVSPAELSDETKKMIKAVSRGDVFVFDIERMPGTDLSLWVEEYEQGEGPAYLHRWKSEAVPSDASYL